MMPIAAFGVFLLLSSGSKIPSQHGRRQHRRLNHNALLSTTKTTTTTSSCLGSALEDHASDKKSPEEFLPEGFSVDHNVISEYAWKMIERWISTDEFVIEHKCAFVKEEVENLVRYKIPWEMGAQSRRVAQFGFRYNYEKDIVEMNDPNTPEIPPRLRDLLRLDEPIMGHVYNFTQCIINVYNPETIIPWHVDDKMFGPVVLVYTFGEDRPLYLRRQREQLNADDHSTISHPADLPWHEFRALEWKDEPDILNPSLYDYSIAKPCHGSRYILSGASRLEWEHAVPRGQGLRISFTFRTEK